MQMHDIGVEYPSSGEMQFYEMGTPPAPQPTQILIRTHYSGISNGTERNWLMSRSSVRRSGYQSVGVVEAAGNQVKAFSEGDMVFLSATHAGWHLLDVGAGPSSGALCVKLPDGVEHEFCALLGVAGICVRHVKRLRVEPGQNVWVAGLGPIGQFSAQAARAYGAYVTGSGKHQDRLDAAKELGAHRVIDASDPSCMELLKERAPYNCIIDACHAPELFADIHANKLLARRGAIGLVAARGEIKFPWSMIHRLEGSFEVTCHFAVEDLKMVLHFLQLGTMGIKHMVSHRVPITEAPSIYETMRDRRSDILGVVFNWKS